MSLVAIKGLSMCGKSLRQSLSGHTSWVESTTMPSSFALAAGKLVL
ncbi:hypothetical protein GCM10011408_05430 [Dyella caseinilytica]|nr:hypothetical protein GCM10011408_05430 [Dyella caseinilytica]